MNKTGQIITLTTDWSNNGYLSRDADAPDVNPIGDQYIAQMKSILFRVSPSVFVIDISHKVAAFNAIQAAYLLKSVYPLLPEGTIHFVGVNSEPSPRNKPVFIMKDGHYFVGANDGMFSMVFSGEPDYAGEIEPDDNLAGFAALKVFAVVVKHLTEGKDPTKIGTPCSMKRDIVSGAAYDENGITGAVVFIDSYGNIITNISREMFEKVGRGRAFKICIHDSKTYIDRLSSYYDDVPEQFLLAMFNSSGMLELALRNGNMAKLENMNTRSVIRVGFDGSRLF